MADIRAITAPIGGGKSLFSVIQLCEELEKTDRLIVTNLPIILENAPPDYWTIAEYCQKFIKRPVNVAARLCVLNYEQTGEFWRYLPAAAFDLLDPTMDLTGIEYVENIYAFGRCRMIKLPNKPNDRFKEVPDFSFRTKYPANRIGCHYIIDEAHKYFPPMFYQRVGAQAEWYMSELRKLNDDLDWVTQHPEKVDKNFRRDCTEWLHVQNMGKVSLFMGVSLNKRFRWHWYNQPEMPVRQDKPTASGWYKIDGKRRYEFLYRTMDGTGVSGGLVKEATRFKGKSPWIWVLALVAIIVAAYLLPRIIQTVVTHVVHGGVVAVQSGIAAGAGSIIPPPVQPGGVAPNNLRPAGAVGAEKPQDVSISRPAAFPTLPPAVPAEPQFYCTGWSRDGTNMMVTLSDGRVLYSSRGEVQDVGFRFVKVLGLPPMEVKTPKPQLPQIPDLNSFARPPQQPYFGPANFPARFQ